MPLELNVILMKNFEAQRYINIESLNGFKLIKEEEDRFQLVHPLDSFQIAGFQEVLTH